MLWESRESISNYIFLLGWWKMAGSYVYNTAPNKVGGAKIFVISIYEDFWAKQHGKELFKHHYSEEEFFFNCMVILLCFGQFLTPICNRTFLLEDYGSHLVVWSISINKCGKDYYGWVGVRCENVSSQNIVHDFESCIHIRCPAKGLFTRFFTWWFQQMHLFRSHQPITVDSTKETVHFLGVVWWFLITDGRNALSPWLETDWS